MDFSAFLQQIMGQMQPYMQQFQNNQFQGGMPWGGRGSFIDGLMNWQGYGGNMPGQPPSISDPLPPAGPSYPPTAPGGQNPPGTYQPAPMPNPVVGQPFSFGYQSMGRTPSSSSSRPLGGAPVSSTPSFTPGSLPAGQSPAAPAPYTGGYSTLPMGRTPGPSAPRTPGTGTTATPSFSTAGNASTIPLGRTPGPSAPRTPGMSTESTFKI